jgi:hypothetical protein
VNTSEYAAVAAAHSVDPDRWWTEFSAVLDRIAPRFRRYEPLRRAGELMAGMVSGLDRKNCWTIAEHRGAVSPDGLQHLLARASWDADAVRDDLRDYVIDAFGDPGAILVVDLYRPRNYAEVWVDCSERPRGGGSLVNGGCAVVGMITGFPGMPARRLWAGSALVVSSPGR